MALPCGVVGWSTVCDCGISWSYLLFGHRRRNITINFVCGRSLALTSTGQGGFLVIVVLCPKAPNAQPAVVLVLKHLSRRDHALKSHMTDWESWESNSGLLGTR